MEVCWPIINTFFRTIACFEHFESLLRFMSTNGERYHEAKCRGENGRYTPPLVYGDKLVNKLRLWIWI